MIYMAIRQVIHSDCKAEVPERLGISGERWREIVVACNQRVVAFDVGEE